MLDRAGSQLNTIHSIEVVVALKRAVVSCERINRGADLLGAGVLGDGLGALGHGVLGQLTGQQKSHGGLDLAGRDRRAAVVVRQAAGLGGDTLEDVVDERVHDAHRLGRDAGVGVHLLQHLVDVDGVRLSPPPALLLVPSTLGLRLGGGLLSSLRCGFGRHSAYPMQSDTQMTAGEICGPFILTDGSVSGECRARR